MRFIRTALAATIVLCAAGVASAQSGGLTVIVTDAAGLPLPGATVTISHETGYVKTTAQLSDKDGICEFPVLRPGQGYSVEVAFPGYNAIREDGLRVSINGTLTVPIQMIEEFQERVKVTAERDVIDLEETVTSTKFSESFISDLPVPGRFYQNVLTMAPGVQDADGDGNPNVHGSRTRDFQAIVSGVSNVDPLTGQWMSNVNPNSIEEMEVITAGAGVEFGRAQGGFARIIQKQGSNTHEGVAEFYWRSSILDGDGARDLSSVSEPDFDWVQPSIQVSGPLIRDKLWYRASLEDRDIDIPVVTGSSTETVTREEKTQDLQLTWQASPRNKVAFQYRADPREWLNLGASSVRSSDATFGLEWDGQTSTITWTAPYSPKVLVESTVAWSDLTTREFPNQVGIQNQCLSQLSSGLTAWLQDAQCANLESGQVTGSYFRTNQDHRQRLTVNGKATVYGGRFWGMTHTFKVGLQFANERYFRNLERNPFVAFQILNDPSEQDDSDTGGDQSPQSVGFLLASVAVPQVDDVRATGSNWGAYVEDQFKPKQNLSITLGVRIDHEEINAEGNEIFDAVGELDNFLDQVLPVSDFTQPGFSQQILTETKRVARANSFTGFEDYEAFTRELQGIVCDGNPPETIGTCQLIVDQIVFTQTFEELEQLRRSSDQFLSNTNVSPKMSVAWSPGSSGKTALKFAMGRNYNNIALLVPLAELEPPRLTVPFTGEIGKDGSFEPEPVDVISPAVDSSYVARDLKTPYQDEFTFTVEREIFAETSVSVTYINRKFKDQIQDINLNLNTGDFGACALQKSPTDPTLSPSWGTGAQIFDVETGLLMGTDTDPGPGDGFLDDCVGESLAFSEGASDDGGGGGGTNMTNQNSFVERPDGIVDLYVQNPFWRDLFLIGNFNEIDYQSWVVELVRRQYRSWEFQSSYTWSEAEGNGEDFFQELGDDPSLREDTFGYQSTDQRHVVKVNATTITPWGVRLGGAVTWQSGLPYSVLYQQVSRDNLPPSTRDFGTPLSRSRQTYVTGRRNSERNESWWNIDLKATKEINLGRGLNLQLSAEVFNALDDDTYQVFNPFAQGGGRGQQVNGVNEAQYRFGRQWQIGAKLAF